MESPPSSQSCAADMTSACACGLLQKPTCQYQLLFKNAEHGILLIDADTSRIVDVNHGLLSLLCYSHAELCGNTLSELNIFANDAERESLCLKLQAVKTVRYDELALRTKTGALIQVEFVSSSYSYDGNTLVQCHVYVVSAHHPHLLNDRRHAQLYAALGECNKAIVDSTTREALFLQICQAAVRFGGMKMAWVGLIDDDTKQVRPAASFGDVAGYLQDVEISADAASPFGRGPTGTAIHTNQPYWCQDMQTDLLTVPWRERAAQAGWAASASLPLHCEGRVIGVFSLYCAETNAFDEAVRELLVEMAADISYALDNFAREFQRQRTQEEIEFKNTILKTQQDTSLDAILVVDELGRIISYNQQFIDLWCLPAALVKAAVDESVLKCVVDQVSNPEAFAARVEYLFEHRDEKSREEILLKDGRIIDRYSAPAKAANGKYFGRVWYFRDITEHKQAEVTLKNMVAKYHTVFELSSDAIMLLNEKGFFDCNEATLEMFDCPTHEDFISKHPAQLSPPTQPGGEDSMLLADQQIKTALNRGHNRFEWVHRRLDGKDFPAEVLLTAMELGGKPVLQAVVRDVTERKAAEDKIERLAFYDQLTSLPNRRLLLDRLQHTVVACKRHNNHGALLFIDLDNFKTLNDTRGHNIGDLLLIEVARRLQDSVREDDTVARLGGDEFVIIMENLHEDRGQAAKQADAVSNKILHAINQSYSLAGYEYHCSASIGISLFRNQECTVDDLLKRADTAMYQAKSAGRNTLHFYDPALQAAQEARALLENDLRRALAENQFSLYYQMQVAHSGQILGAEVLIRWQHPQRGMISPLEFIPLAEEIGLITMIGQWVLETACAQLKAWADTPLTRDLQLAVNVSARQFYQADFVEQVRETLNFYGINPGLLKFELTESMVLDKIRDTITKMQALREIGVRFSMDDFGIGYSSLSYLTQLPLDQLKIDQSFVRNITEKHSDAVIVQTIIGMAHNLRIEVIAEGVETAQQRDFLQQHGCSLYQGYLFGKPVPINEFEAMLNTIFLPV